MFLLTISITECLNINSNSMFDIRSETNNSVRKNVQDRVEHSKDLEVDVTDAKKEGQICPENKLCKSYNDQTKASKRDILNVASPLLSQNSLMCSQNLIHSPRCIESNIHVLRNSANGKK